MNEQDKEQRERLISHMPEDRRKFYELHGDFVLENGEVLFEDGATEESGQWRRFPAKDDYERGLKIKRFWTIKARNAVEDFHDMRRILYARPSEDKQTHAKQIKHLEELRDEARFAQRKLRRAEKALDNTTEGRILKASKAQRAEGGQRNQEFRKQIDSIQL